MVFLGRRAFLSKLNDPKRMIVQEIEEAIEFFHGKNSQKNSPTFGWRNKVQYYCHLDFCHPHTRLLFHL